MGKSGKCSGLNLDHPASFFFWGLIIMLFLLVIGNFILTCTIISFFKIGMGMESIKLIPELKTIKFYGTTDFNKVYKKDGIIESFRDEPAVIEAVDSFIKFNLADRKGNVNNRFIMGANGTEFKNVNLMIIRDTITNHPIFTSTQKLKYNLEKPARNLESTAVYAAEVSSPIDKKLHIQSLSMFLRGIEGTLIDGKDVFVSAKQNIFLKSTNGSIDLSSANGIYIDASRIPKVQNEANNVNRSDLKFKLCICLPKGKLFLVSISKFLDVFRNDEKNLCTRFDRSKYDPCI